MQQRRMELFTAKSGKHFANPQVGAFHDKMGAEPKSETTAKSEHGEANMPHSSETHGTQPHPKTGVHSVHVMHMGGGHAMTHTHHDGGHIESKHHASLQEAHDHAQSMLPPDEMENEESMMHGEPDGDEGMDEALGGMMGGSGE